jgi:hypothetical protein
MNDYIQPYGSWDELEKEIFTPEEIAACDKRVAKIVARINAREERREARKQAAATAERAPLEP